MIRKILITALTLIFLALTVISCDVTVETSESSSSESQAQSESESAPSQSESTPPQQSEASSSESQVPSEQPSESESESTVTDTGFEFKASSTVYTIGKSEKISFEIQGGGFGTLQPIDVDIEVVESSASTTLDHTDSGIFLTASEAGMLHLK